MIPRGHGSARKKLQWGVFALGPTHGNLQKIKNQINTLTMMLFGV